VTAEKTTMAFGWRVCGLGVMAVGMACLAFGEFDSGQPVAENFPARTALAYAAGAFMVVAASVHRGTQQLEHADEQPKVHSSNECLQQKVAPARYAAQMLHACGASLNLATNPNAACDAGSVTSGIFYDGMGRKVPIIRSRCNLDCEDPWRTSIRSTS
jgi:hypothetical protein